MARGAVIKLLDGCEGAVRREPLGVLVRERNVVRIARGAAGGEPCAVVGLELLGALGEQVDVARKGRGTGIGRAERVGGVYRQELPVLHAHIGQVVHKAVGVGADGAGGLAGRARHRGDVADHARAGAERLLQADVGVEVHHGGAERPELDLDLSVLVDLERMARDDVGGAGAERLDLDRMRVGRAPVDDHGCGLARLLVLARVGEHVVVQREGADAAAHHDGKRAADRGGVLDHGLEVRVARVLGARQGAAVARVGEALEAVLVAVVDRRHAREGHLHEGGEPVAALGEVELTGGEAVGAALLLGQGVVERGAAEHRDDARAVVAADEVEGAVQGLGGVVLAEGLDGLSDVVGRVPAHEQVEHDVAERVVHGRVELGAEQVAAELAVADLVGGVFPDLADHEAVGALGERRLLDLLDHVVRELVGYVEPPAAGTGAQPVADYAALAEQALLHELGVLVEGGHVADAPPAVVGAVLVEAVGVAPGRVLALVGAHARVVAVFVEVARVVTRVVEDAVEDDRDAELLGGGAQALEVLLGAEDRVDLEVVAGVVAVAALGLEDRVKVDRGESELMQARKVVLNALERAAVEVPAGDGVVGVARVGGRRAPVVDDAAGGAVVGDREGLLGALAPVVVAGIAVGEDLVDHAALVPARARLAVLVDGELEGGNLGVVVDDALAAVMALRCADAQLGPVLELDDEAVPDDIRLVPGEGARIEALAVVLHRVDLLADFVDPRPQADCSDRPLRILCAQGERHAVLEFERAERRAVFG